MTKANKSERAKQTFKFNHDFVTIIKVLPKLHDNQENWSIIVQHGSRQASAITYKKVEVGNRISVDDIDFLSFETVGFYDLQVLLEERGTINFEPPKWSYNLNEGVVGFEKVILMEIVEIAKKCCDYRESNGSFKLHLASPFGHITDSNGEDSSGNWGDYCRFAFELGALLEKYFWKRDADYFQYVGRPRSERGALLPTSMKNDAGFAKKTANKNLVKKHVADLVHEKKKTTHHNKPAYEMFDVVMKEINAQCRVGEKSVNGCLFAKEGGFKCYAPDGETCNLKPKKGAIRVHYFEFYPNPNLEN